MSVSLIEGIVWSAAIVLLGAGLVLLAQRWRAPARKDVARDAEFARAQLEAFFEHVPVAMSLHGLDGQFIFGTRQVLKSYGLSADELARRGMGSLAHFWPEFDKLATATMKAASTGMAQRLVTPFRGAGEVEDQLFDVVVFPIRAADGAIIQIGSLGIDVTAQHRAQEALTRSRATLQAFFDNVPAMTFIVSLDRRYITANTYAIDHYGLEFLSPENLIGQPDTTGTPPDWHDVIAEAHRTAVEDGKPFVTEPSIDLPDGTLNLHVSRFPIRNDQGEITHVGGLIFDLTEQKKAEQEAEEARAMLTSLLDHMPAGIAVFDREHKLRLLNAMPAQLMPVPREKQIGSHVSEFRQAWPDFDELLQAGMAVLADGEPRKLTLPVVEPLDGQSILFDIVCFPIRSESGQIEHLGLFLLDVSQQDSARREAEKNRAIFEAFVSNAPNPMALLEPDGRYVMVNNATASHYELTPEELLAAGPKFINSRFTEARTKIAPMFARVASSLEMERIDTKFEMLTGEVRDMSFSFFPILGPGGELDLIGNISFDQTEEHRAKEALHQSEKLAALGQLLAGVAHELNNPLTVVVGRSAILEEKLVGTPHEKAIAGLREAADRCNRIVKTFLAMARQSAPRRGPVRVNEVVEAALDMTTYGIRSAGIDLELSLGQALPEVEADEDQLIQVVTNLLINAQHALDGREGPRRIGVATKASRDAITIEITDNGPGVPDHLASRIFEPFFTTKDVGQGTGMGLAMSRGMIAEHGGTLTYRAAAEGGACFVIALPRSNAAEDSAPASPSVAPAASVRGRVLIVDDEAAIRAMLSEILAACELDCIEAADGREALDRIAAEPFDLIFCDVRMPVLDGIGLRRELADTRPELLERLVFMSGDVLQRDRANYAEIGDHRFVEKPFDPAEARRIALDLLGQAGDAR